MRRTVKLAVAVAAAVPLAFGAAIPAQADSDNAKVGFGTLYFQDETVRTVATPTSTPGKGVDAIYPVANGVAGQIPVTSVAPGNRGYHGGRWAVNLVTWTDAPYLLTSAADVAAAQSAGYITIERVEAADFVCPIRGGGGKG